MRLKNQYACLCSDLSHLLHQVLDAPTKAERDDLWERISLLMDRLKALKQRIDFDRDRPSAPLDC